MCTNASVFSCSFSDWCYEEEAVRGQVGVEEVGRYLRGYRERYLPAHTVRTGTEVRSVEKEDDGWWCVNGQERFEFLVVATGAFSQPYIPLVETLGKFKGTAVHSAHYVAEEILPLEETRKRRILVIGGCLSGAEVPADIALRIASMPETTRRNVELLHLFTKPPWILPKMLPFLNEADPTAPR
jgi:cation diffusion facilitator CzcD-associated flavoprotein CzcO